MGWKLTVSPEGPGQRRDAGQLGTSDERCRARSGVGVRGRWQRPWPWVGPQAVVGVADPLAQALSEGRCGSGDGWQEWGGDVQVLRIEDARHKNRYVDGLGFDGEDRDDQGGQVGRAGAAAKRLRGVGGRFGPAVMGPGVV
jgi:hypothetical protein